MYENTPDAKSAILLLDAKLDNVNASLEKLVTLGVHLERRIDMLEQNRRAMRAIAGLLAFVAPFVIGGSSLLLNLYIENLVRTEIAEVM